MALEDVVNMVVVLGSWLGLMILKAFSNFNDSIILCIYECYFLFNMIERFLNVNISCCKSRSTA